MIHHTVKCADITAEIIIFVAFTIGCYYDSLLNSKIYILPLGDIMFKYEIIPPTKRLQGGNHEPSSDL